MSAEACFLSLSISGRSMSILVRIYGDTWGECTEEDVALMRLRATGGGGGRGGS